MTAFAEEPGRPHRAPEENSRHGRLSFRLMPPIEDAGQPGLIRLESTEGSELGLGYVPERRKEEARLVLLFHGAGGDARQGLELLLPIADRDGLLLLAAKSRLSTWDVIVDGYGADVERIDRLLEEVTSVYPVTSLSVGGFSDGASYALSLGIANGDLFDSVIAFSPGFAAPMVRHGSPRIFISHGRQDPVLPVEACSRRLVQRLRTQGYDLVYEEFDDGHVVPESVLEQVHEWLSTTGSSRG